MSNLVMKKCFVAELCPHVITTRQYERLLAVRDAVELGDSVVVFEGETIAVSAAYFKELCGSFDYGPHVAWLECQLQQLLRFVEDSPVYAARKKADVLCKNCGGTKFINCGTHFVCDRCAVVRTMVHDGQEYREMASRESLNGASRAHNRHYSSSFNQLCDLRGVPEKYVVANERMQYSCDKTRRLDMQLYSAQEKMLDVCARWQLPRSVALRAHRLFCSLRQYMDRLCGRDALICACLMYGLPSLSLSLSDLGAIGQHFVRRGKDPVLYTVTGIGVRGFVLVVRGASDARGVNVTSACDLDVRATSSIEVIGPTLRVSLLPGDVYFLDTFASSFSPVTSMGTNKFSRALLSGAEIFTDGIPIHMS